MAASICGLVISGPQIANASAGYVPTYPGDRVEVSGFLPKGHANYVYLQGTSFGVKYRNLAKFKPTVEGPDIFCEKNELMEKFTWKVNVKGSWTLYFYDPKTKKRNYCSPDGIESN